MGILTKELLGLDGVFTIKVPVYRDNRGSFSEIYNQNLNKLFDSDIEWVQDNESISKKFVFRGLHFQKGSHSQSKLIRVSNGEILDVMVDLRNDSKTFKKLITINIKSTNVFLFVPKGIAHGFLSLSDNTIVNYKCDNIYNSNSESGVNPFKSNLKIDWGVNLNKIKISKKDKGFPSLDESYIFD
tara:strand:+ start:144 stop:698 length:555 start_codon:yes stop_codon:yes gene_type:complete